MKTVSYPMLARLALDDAWILTAAGTDLDLWFAETVMNLPSIRLSEHLTSQMRADERLPVMSSEVSDVDGVTVQERCGQLLNEWRSAHPEPFDQNHQAVVVLCPEGARLTISEVLPDHLSDIHWAFDLPSALDQLNGLAVELMSSVLFVSVDSLIDHQTHRHGHSDLATEKNPEGVIPAEAVCAIQFSPSEQPGLPATSAVEPFAAQASTEATEAIASVMPEFVPAQCLSNRSTNNSDVIAEWYRVFGSPQADLANLSTRQSLGDTGLAEAGLVLALALAKARYEQSDTVDCLIFQELLRLHWRPQRTGVNQHQGTHHE